MPDQPHQSLVSFSKRPDGFTIWPLLIPVVTALAVGTAISFSATLSILAPIPAILVIAVWLLGMLVAISLAGVARAWRRLGSLLAVLVIAMPATLMSLLAGDYIHFLIALPYYAITIASPRSGPGAIYFHRPSAGLIPSYERNLVYDPSDALASHVGKLEKTGPDPGGERSVRHYIGHFYLVEDTW